MKYYSISEAIAIIVVSTAAVSGSAAIGLKWYLEGRQMRCLDTRYFIKEIVQTGPEKEALKTTYLSELLGLSRDRPVSLYLFDPLKGKERLLSSPLIKEASVSLQKPHTLRIEYTVRHPIAWVGDFFNVAVDGDGYPFPIAPFLTPKTLPKWIFGIEEIAYLKPLPIERFQLAMEISELLKKEAQRYGFQIQTIDMSLLNAKSYGQRQVIVVLEQQGIEHFLRLSPNDIPKQLGNYLVLKEELTYHEQEERLTGKPKKKVIDLRLPDLAYLDVLNNDL